MSLTSTQIEALLNEIKHSLQDCECLDFFEISPKKYLLVLKKEQKISKLLLCLKEPYLRFHLTKDEYKKASGNSFSHHIASHLIGKTLVLAEILNEDRTLSLKFQKKGQVFYLICELFPKKPNLYLLNDDQKILSSLYQPNSDFYVLPPKPLFQKKEVLEVTNEAIEKFYRDKETEDEFKQRKNQAKQYLEKLVFKACRKKAQRQQTLEACQRWKEAQHEGLLLQANFFRLKRGMEKVTLQDWENEGKETVIELDPKYQPIEEVERRFNQSKKLKTGLSHAQSSLERIEKEIIQLEKRLQQFETVQSIDQLAPYLPPTIEQRPVIAVPYREYHSASGYKIWVGKSGSKNEELTFKYANGLDWWFHVMDYPGSHVVLKVPKGQEPDPESILDAGQLALRYSKAKSLQEVDVCYTQCKFISRLGIKGKAGKVQISKHQVLRVRLDEERWKRLNQPSSSLKR